jgi:hypothetical protein
MWWGCNFGKQPQLMPIAQPTFNFNINRPDHVSDQRSCTTVSPIKTLSRGYLVDGCEKRRVYVTVGSAGILAVKSDKGRSNKEESQTAEKGR